MTIKITITREEGSSDMFFSSFEEASFYIETEWRESLEAKNKKDDHI